MHIVLLAPNPLELKVKVCMYLVIKGFVMFGGQYWYWNVENS